MIDDRRVSDAQSFPDGQMNQGWLTRSSTIANSNGPFDPEVYGYPAVDFANYGNEYNAALMNLVGTITEGDAIYDVPHSMVGVRARAGICAPVETFAQSDSSN